VKRGRYSWRWFGCAAAFSLLVHVIAIPKLIAPAVALTKKSDDLEISYLDESPPTPEIPTPDTPEEKEKKKAEAKKKEEKLAKAPEPAKLPEPPKPVPVKPVIAQQAPPPPPPKPMIDKRKQMVDQERPDEADNPDAKYLAQTNHRTQKETRMESTNLIRERAGAEQSTAPNENQDPKPGEKDQKIAQLENHKGTDLPREAPQQGKEGQSADPRQQKPGPLSMRNLVPRNSERAEVQQREGLEQQEREHGELAMQRKGQDGQRGGAMKKGGKVNLQLDHHAFDNIEGFATAERERREAAKAEGSHVKGRYDKYLGRLAALRSSIENFTPDVKVGNQAELGTRASPFAAYITAMHRQIHQLWTFGFLADHEMRIGHDPFDDETLWTQVQIQLHGDGTLDRVGVIRASGNTAFDAAAVDSVMSAAPFPKPPASIRSANGKVYLDWQFHRDERACGTFGVDPHILTTPGEDVVHDSSETGLGQPHMQHRGKGPLSPAAGAGGAAEGTQSSEEEGPRHLEREASKPTPEPEAVPTVTEAVHDTAEGWFAAWGRGDVSWLAGWSAVPFLANGQIAAKTPDALRDMYKQMLSEVQKRKVRKVEVLTPGGMRAKAGSLPPGGQDSGMLFAVAEAGGERFVLLLRKADQGWRVAGLAR
jgi:TonB family protein